MAKITDLTYFIDVYIEKRAAAAQGKGYVRLFLLMDLQDFLQGEVSYHIPIVAEDYFVFIQEIFNVFQSSCRFQKDRFITEDYRHTAPMPGRKFFRVDFRQIMSIHDESIYTDFQKMIHHIGDYGTSSDLQ
jgi:hypothetical protein